MKYPYTTKNWKSIKRGVDETLKDKTWKPTVYFCKDGFIIEVDFTKKFPDGSLAGGCYQSCSCSQPLLKRIAAMIPKKFWKKA